MDSESNQVWYKICTGAKVSQAKWKVKESFASLSFAFIRDDIL